MHASGGEAGKYEVFPCLPLITHIHIVLMVSQALVMRAATFYAYYSRIFIHTHSAVL